MASHLGSSRFRIALLCFVGLSLANVQQARAHADSSAVNRFALVVGIDQYADHSLPELRYATNDAIQFAQTLRPLGFSVETLTGQAATKAAVLRYLRLLIEQANSESVILLYFSGHGFGVGTEGYIALSDTQSRDSGRSALS